MPPSPGRLVRRESSQPRAESAAKMHPLTPPPARSGSGHDGASLFVGSPGRIPVAVPVSSAAPSASPTDVPPSVSTAPQQAKACPSVGPSPQACPPHRPRLAPPHSPSVGPSPRPGTTQVQQLLHQSHAGPHAGLGCTHYTSTQSTGACPGHRLNRSAISQGASARASAAIIHRPDVATVSAQRRRRAVMGVNVRVQ